MRKSRWNLLPLTRCIQTIPLFVTSLLIPFLSVVLRVVREDEPHRTPVRLSPRHAMEAIFASMWTPVIMLLLGGFTLAAALSKCSIDRRLATLVLSKAGPQPKAVLMANIFVAAVASMLISNVAAPVLCYSIIEVCLPHQWLGLHHGRRLISVSSPPMHPLPGV